MKITQSGFTLMELMITVVIIGILGTVASSTYSSYAISSKRTDGRIMLKTTAATLEKCRALYGVYNSANCSVANGASLLSSEQLYKIGVVSTASSFTLKTTAVSGKSQAKDTDCTSIILNNLGQQTGTGANSSECW